MTWHPVNRRAQLAWEQQKRQSPLRRKVGRKLRELRSRMANGKREKGDLDRYRLASSLLVDGLCREALGVLDSATPPAPMTRELKAGKVIKFPGVAS